MLPMPLIPVTFLFGLLCLGLLYRLGRPQARRWVFQLLLLLCAWQSLLVGLRYGYGLTQFNGLQPFGAVAIPPLTYLAFLVSTQGRLRWRELWHLTPLCLTLLASLLAPFWLDILIVATDLGYGAALLYALRRGENALQQVPLAESWLSYRLWRGLGMLLVAIAAAEGVIVLDFAYFEGRHAAMLATFDNLLVALSICLVLSRSRPSETPAESVPEPPDSVAEDEERLAEWFGLVQHRLRQDDLYLEPELNLARLARKAGLPARRVSQAINRHTGMNVSQYVNQLRIRQAAQWLLDGDDPVTDIMQRAGFTTKSNFNREFLRIQGVSPSEWRRQQKVS
ncbi:helix-turn-helix transcriptional regulator [Serratia plymuthica]|uniref:AraC family transcriptional regulator n=1 Tax=Serratia plymuthica S13 TaxID=1348660 RepID=S4YRQ1_SERPL|nr:AraC family transcriptional regulator [Serratia plymuthica]AGP45698.1 AraC family transcriptional regulator [Serratia plymuthica S13]ANJ94505.1 AraC family transcriptional regulator [Serratia plymuthica]KYG16847.1 HTH-type transcriptional activator Btr [Serratia plymuthica]NIC29507.1 helix-turn-helix transcriptional regulator [Serratia plymuthica]QQT80138.1 helix-turn-helix transcriptional regulator [Serratia plymuthica]